MSEIETILARLKKDRGPFTKDLIQKVDDLTELVIALYEKEDNQ